MAAPEEENYLTLYRRFLIEFTATVNPNDPLPVKVTGYTLDDADIEGEIIDWTLQYLNQKNCPQALATSIARSVLEEMRVVLKENKELRSHSEEDNDVHYDPLRLMHAVVSKVRDVCKRCLSEAEHWDIKKCETCCLLPPSPGPPFISTYAIKNHRRRMEDRHVAFEDLNSLFNMPTSGKVGYYAIFDGHHGHEAAAYSAAQLHGLVVHSKHYPEDPEAALRDAFFRADEIFIKKCASSKLLSGTTALVALVNLGKSLHVAWLGDSLGILVRSGGKITQLVNPHTADRPDERKRIEEEGGVVIMHFSTWRINGTLAISRAIGDPDCKPHVSAVADVVTHKLDGSEHFIILACDGLWDCVTEEHAASVVYEHLRKEPGMVDAGIGPSQWNALLSALNIPVCTERLWKRHERIAGPALENVAQESCNAAIALERSLTSLSPISTMQSHTNSPHAVRSSTPKINIAASYDMGWQKRGNGRSYDSLTGHASLIGLKSKKILNYGVRSKICKLCISGHPKDDHDCRLNFSGSAKAMESSLAVELASAPSLKEANVEVGVIIGDDDSATLSALRKGYNSGIEKWSDINHAKKGLVSMLYGLKKHHKELNTMTISYLKRCFSYALEQNKYNVEGTKEAILNIVNHAFDEHDNCGSWCTFLYNKELYCHKGLPGGKSLKGENLRSNLMNVFNKFALIANKLAPCGSSQQNEAFNAMVAAKAPKAKHYGGSESLGYRVAAAVNQKNLGATYLSRLQEKLSLSPGCHGEKYRRKLEMRRMQRSINKAKLCVKRRRLFLKRTRSQKCWRTENKEGITYNSNVALIPNFSLSTKQPIPHQSKALYFDLETTGLGRLAEICQIAAECEDGAFSMYVMPAKPMSAKATEVTGISVVEDTMFLKNIPVQAFPLKVAMENFLKFLKSINRPFVLVGHNILRFDLTFLMRDLEELGFLADFEGVCAGFVDTLHLFKKIVPGLKSYKQTCLASQFLVSGNENAHNAVNDVDTLKRLVDEFKIGDKTIFSYALSFQEYVSKKVTKGKVLAAKKSLEKLKGHVLSSAMIGKISKQFICYDDLLKIYSDSGKEGIKLLFGEDVDGKPRITKNKRILSSLVNHFSSL